ncbi:SHOCT domain-containing protein [Microlunatus ginsengisoli]|uniref:SHOCT domain-containing protein n=1 Tax=Microlunatus ginsengisoli TaxID=363863 RepID=A0ABP7ALB8_9ACTN
MMGMGSGMMAGAWLGGLIFLLLAIAAAAAIVLLVRNRSHHATSVPSSPRELLAHRFARGEIDDEEYYLRLSALDATDTTSQPRRR